jgi:hypothetical protein
MAQPVKATGAVEAVGQQPQMPAEAEAVLVLLAITITEVSALRLEVQEYLLASQVLL